MFSSTRAPELNSTAMTAARTYFTDMYSNKNNDASVYTDLVVNMNDFAAKVALINNGTIATDDLAIKFIHRYDVTNARLYATVQLCEIGANASRTDTPEPYNLYPLTCMALYFNINIDGSLGTYNGDLDGTDSDQYSQVYFDNVLYGGEALQLNLNTHGVCMPWNQLVKLAADNVTSNRGTPSLFSIGFAATSSPIDDTNESSVTYPHCIAVYLSYDGTACLDSTGYIVGNFLNKAADFNSLCPPTCNQIAYAIGHVPGRS